MARVEGECWCGEKLTWEATVFGHDETVYPYDDVPPEVAEEMDGKVDYCKNCTAFITLSLPRVERVAMRIER